MSHLAGEGLNERKVVQFKTAVLVFSARNMPRRGWYHIGTRRNNNLRQFIWRKRYLTCSASVITVSALDAHPERTVSAVETHSLLPEPA